LNGQCNLASGRNTNRFKDGGLFTNGIMGEKYLINIVEKENPAN
jgi:hypothetical protein